MSSTKRIALILGIPFAALTAYALLQVGYMGIVNSLFAGPGAWQVAADLVVALVLVCTWMITDARKHGRNVWPYIVATLCLGSFGPLAYLILAPSEAASGHVAAQG